MPLDDQLRTLGRIAVAFNLLEYRMNVLAWALINPNSNIGRIALEGENFDRMLNKTTNLAREVFREDPGRLSRIEQWAKSASDVKRRRNELLHAQWGLYKDTGSLRGQTLLRKVVRNVDSADLDRLADDIDAALQELMDIMQGLAQFPQLGSKQ
jgi:hypothetical protein